MAKNKSIYSSSYELLCSRVKKIIDAPEVQKKKSVTLVQNENEKDEDWERLIEEFETIESVRIINFSCGKVCLCWETVE